MEGDTRREPAPVLRRRPSLRDQPFHFSAGEVLSTSFRIFGRHLPILVLLAAVFHALPTFLGLKLAETMAETWREAIRTREMPGYFQMIGGPLGVATMLAGWVLPLAFQAVVTFAVFQTLRGGPPRYVESIGKGFKRLLPALGASFFVGLAVFLPMVIIAVVFAAIGGRVGAVVGLLGGVIYAAIMACTWYVAIQVAIVEGANPMKSMSRSAHLTKRARRRIFGIVLVVYVLPAVLAWLIQQFLLAPVDPRVVDTSRVFLQAGLGVVFGGLAAVTSVVVYHALRNAKEGVDLDQLLAVFD